MKWIRQFWFELALTAGGVFVVLLGVGGLFVGAHLGGSEGRAQIGDFVGGTTTPVLTALTFIGVLIGIALQRRELIATREELERSAGALEQQVANLEKQELSRSFFDLYRMYSSVVDGLSFGSGDSRRTGKAALERYADDFSPVSYYGSGVWELEDVKNYHSRHNDELASYFRIIFRILLFLDEQGENGDFFADMFRA